LRDGAFFNNVAHISGDTGRIFTKIYHKRCIIGQESSRYILEVVRIPDPQYLHPNSG